MSDVEFQGKIITLTGLDRVGKETQSFLLKEALRRSGHPVETMSFPEYGRHWAAEMVRATLNEESVTVQRAGGQPLGFFPTKQPYIFQMWQSADRLDKQPWIEHTLKHAHIISDRYEIDALAYGLVDGCREEWLWEMNELYRPSDLAIVFVGEPFPRKGERPDLNERDGFFQQRVRDAYERLCSEDFRERFKLLRVDAYRQGDPIHSKYLVHVRVCEIVQNGLGLLVERLDIHTVRALERVRLGG